MERIRLRQGWRTDRSLLVMLSLEVKIINIKHNLIHTMVIIFSLSSSSWLQLSQREELHQKHISLSTSQQNIVKQPFSDNFIGYCRRKVNWEILNCSLCRISTNNRTYCIIRFVANTATTTQKEFSERLPMVPLR